MPRGMVAPMREGWAPLQGPQPTTAALAQSTYPVGVVAPTGAQEPRLNPEGWNDTVGAVLAQQYQQQRAHQQLGWQVQPVRSPEHMALHHPLVAHPGLVSSWQRTNDTPSPPPVHSSGVVNISLLPCGHASYSPGQHYPLRDPTLQQQQQQQQFYAQRMPSGESPWVQHQQQMQDQVTVGMEASPPSQSSAPALPNVGAPGLQAGSMLQFSGMVEGWGSEAFGLSAALQQGSAVGHHAIEGPVKHDDSDEWAMALGAALGSDSQVSTLLSCDHVPRQTLLISTLIILRILKHL